MNKEPYSSLYKILGFYPDNIHLYEQAFLHKSSSVESGDGRWLNNERLEFAEDEDGICKADRFGKVMCH